MNPFILYTMVTIFIPLKYTFTKDDPFEAVVCKDILHALEQPNSRNQFMVFIEERLDKSGPKNSRPNNNGHGKLWLNSLFQYTACQIPEFRLNVLKFKNTFMHWGKTP